MADGGVADGPWRLERAAGHAAFQTARRAWASATGEGETTDRAARFAEHAEGLRQAEAHYRAALELAETFGPRDSRLADSLDDLIRLQRYREEYHPDGYDPQAMERYARRLLALQEATLGPDHPALLGTLTVLEQAAWSQGRHDEEIAAAERRLAIRERAFGPDHPELARTLSHLASLLERHRDRDREAAALRRRALALREAAPPDAYAAPEAAAHRQEVKDLAENLIRQGQYAAPAPHLRRWLALCEARFGPGRAMAGPVERDLAQVCARQGKHEEAVAWYHRAVATFERGLGPWGPWAWVVGELADLHAERREWAQGEQVLRRAIAVVERAVADDDTPGGPGHWYRVAIRRAVPPLWRQLGDLLATKGDHAAAEAAYRELIARCEQQRADPEFLPGALRELLSGLRGRAAVLRALGRAEQAAEMASRAEELRAELEARGLGHLT